MKLAPRAAQLVLMLILGTSGAAPRAVAQATLDDPSWGPPDAPVTVVVFCDFQCVNCAGSRGVLDSLVQRRSDQVRLVFRDFPLDSHKEAGRAAEAATCAHEQRQFWPMAGQLFANQRDLHPAALKRYARELGLDTAAFDRCLDSGRHRAEWQQDRADGKAKGVKGTPTFFVNGTRVQGAQGLDDAVTAALP